MYSNDTASPGASIWRETFRVADRPPLTEHLRVDVCIIGAGIAGMTTAYLLAKGGHSVAVVEDGSIGSGMTGFTTAHLTVALDDRYYEIERFHGEKGARLAAWSHLEAIDCIERIVNDERIECDFSRLDGYLFTPPGDTTENLERELEALQRAGLTDVVRVGKAPIPGFDTGSALRFPNQGQFHPLKYLDGLAGAIERLGGKLFCHTHAETVEGGDDARVETKNGAAIRAAAIVVATNVPINDRLVIHTKQAPYTSYVIGVEIAVDAVVPALYWDTRQSIEDPIAGMRRTTMCVWPKVPGAQHRIRRIFLSSAVKITNPVKMPNLTIALRIWSAGPGSAGLPWSGWHFVGQDR